MNIPLKASQRSDVFSFLPISQHPTPVNKGKKSDWNIKVYHPCSNIVFNRQLHGRISQFLPHFLVWTSQFLPHFLVWTRHEDQPLNPEGQCKFEHDHLLLLESMLWSRTKAINTNKECTVWGILTCFAQDLIFKGIIKLNSQHLGDWS